MYWAEVAFTACPDRRLSKSVSGYLTMQSMWKQYVSITTNTRGTVWVLGTSPRWRFLQAYAFSSSGSYHIHVSSFLIFLCLLTIINYSHKNNCMLSLASFTIFRTWRRSEDLQGIWDTYFQEFGEEEIQFPFNLSKIQLTVCSSIGNDDHV